MPEPDIAIVQAAATKMKLSGGPVAYALDFGVLSDVRTALVEVNDGFALGYYKGACSYKDFSRLLHGRWTELTSSNYFRLYAI